MVLGAFGLNRQVSKTRWEALNGGMWGGALLHSNPVRGTNPV